MVRNIARLTVAALLVLALSGIPTPQATVTPNGDTSISVGHDAADAKHKPCDRAGWHTWKPKKPSRLHNQKVLTIKLNERKRGAWINCRYQSIKWGFTLPTHTWTETVPHK